MTPKDGNFPTTIPLRTAVQFDIIIDKFRCIYEPLLVFNKSKRICFVDQNHLSFKFKDDLILD